MYFRKNDAIITQVLIKIFFILPVIDGVLKFTYDNHYEGFVQLFSIYIYKLDSLMKPFSLSGEHGAEKSLAWMD